MTQQIYTPSIRLVPQIGLTNPPTGYPITLTQLGSGSLTGTYRYVWEACLDATGQFRTALAGEVVASGVVSKSLIRVTWPNGALIPGARWYRLYRSKDGVGGGYKLIWEGPMPASQIVDDYTVTPTSTITPTSSNTSTTTVDFPLRPGQSAVSGRATYYFNLADVRSVWYEEVQADDEMIETFANFNLASHVFGRRRHTLIHFSVEPGSPEDQALLTIYNANLLYPDTATTPGVKVYLSLNWGFGNPTLDEVRIKGQIARMSSPEEPLTRVEADLEFVNVSVAQTIPWANMTDGTAVV